ncbi:MAG: hydrogenase maturation protease [Dermatophilaceae bacterium]
MSSFRLRALLDGLDDPNAVIFGIGNVGRQDDGLGWAFVDWVEQLPSRPAAQLVRGYQLQLEDADLVSRASAVLFVDSTKQTSVRCFSLYRPVPLLDFSFTSHALSIPSVLATSASCFGVVPEAAVLAIRGYEWQLQTGLTDRAAANLDAATAYLCSLRTEPIREPA